MQLPEAEGLVSRTRAKAVVLLNAQWTDTKSVPSRHGGFVGSFDTVYCFQPIAIRVRSLILQYSWQKASAEHGDIAKQGQQFSLNLSDPAAAHSYEDPEILILTSHQDADEPAMR